VCEALAAPAADFGVPFVVPEVLLCVVPGFVTRGAAGLNHAHRLVPFTFALAGLSGVDFDAPAVVPVISLLVYPKTASVTPGLVYAKLDFAGLGERDLSEEDDGDGRL
jgi:hypothetical protein